MPSIFRIKKAVCFAADGKATSFKVGDEIPDTHPMFGAIGQKFLAFVRKDEAAPVAIAEPKPAPAPAPKPEPEPEPVPVKEEIPEPTPHEKVYEQAKAAKTGKKKGGRF